MLVHAVHERTERKVHEAVIAAFDSFKKLVRIRRSDNAKAGHGLFAVDTVLHCLNNMSRRFARRVMASVLDSPVHCVARTTVLLSRRALAAHARTWLTAV